MSAAELLTTVVIVAVLVTVLLLGTTHIGGRLWVGDKPVPDEEPGDDSWYFVRYDPSGGVDPQD